MARAIRGSLAHGTRDKEPITLDARRVSLSELRWVAREKRCRLDVARTARFLLLGFPAMSHWFAPLVSGSLRAMLELTLVTPVVSVPPARPDPTRLDEAARDDVAVPTNESRFDASKGEVSSLTGMPDLFDRCKRPSGKNEYRITLPSEAQLNDLVDWMMSVSCQKFIWDPAVRSGKINIVAPEPVTLLEAYAAFYSALQTMGLTLEDAGSYFKIVETSKSVGDLDLPIYGPDAEPPSDDRYVTKLVRPPAGRMEDVVAVFDHLKTGKASVATIGEIVVVTDTGARIRQLIQVLDQLPPSGTFEDKLFLYRVRNGDPESMIEVINAVFVQPTAPRTTASANGTRSAKGADASGAERSGGTADTTRLATSPQVRNPRIAVDLRTGTILVRGLAEDYAPIRRLLQELDVPQGDASSQLHVIRLRHADAGEVEAVLAQLSGSGATPQDRKAPDVPGTQGVTLTGAIKVASDPATQTLVVMSSYADFQAIRHVVEALDIERRQVYVEVYLLELSSTLGRKVGTSGHAAAANEQGLGFVGSAPDRDTNSVSLDGSLLSGLAAGVLGAAIPGSGALLGLGQDIPAFGLVIQAIENRADVNVIAEPHVYTADHQTARIEVGSKVPMQSGTTTVPGAPASGGTFTQVNRENVSLQVEITPHVADDSTITLDVKMEDSTLGDRNIELNSFTTNTRRLELSKIVAHDGQPIVLGGLVREEESVTHAGVPGVGSIPLVGWLFKRRERERRETNLLMIMVPHVLDGPEDARRVHARRLAERMEFLTQKTAFKHRDLAAHVDYPKKSGLLAAVNRAAEEQDRDADLVRLADAELNRSIEDSVIELGPGSN